MSKKSYVTVTDMFCGAGGSSRGAFDAGAEVVMAMNHWKLAIETHNTNFPQTDHDCANISNSDPRRYPSTDILIASPECFPAGSLVLTDEGFEPIEGIKIGDLVLTHMNRWRRVVRTQSRVASTVIVKGQGHTVGIEMTPNHRLFVRAQSQKWDNAKRDYNRRIFSEPAWVPAEQLLDQKYRWCTPTRIEHPYLGDYALPAGLGSSHEEAWWLIGRWIGDGSLSFGRHNDTTISCGKAEKSELVNRLANTGANWRCYEKRTAINFTLTDPTLRDWLFRHFGHGAANKGIPGWVFALSSELRRQLLEGYLSADGHRNHRRTRADTVSKSLALGVRLLAESLGYRAGVYRYEQHSTQIEGRTINALPVWAVAWENNNSNREAFEENGQSWELIKDIEPGRENVTVYNIEVDEDHSYVVEGIVVANCTNHSLAKGKQRTNQRQMKLWGSNEPDPAEERSRATMFDVPRFAEYHNYNVIIVENVVDARHWVMWDAWLHAMDLLGYHHEIVYLNSMFMWPTPQSRDRMYVVFWKKGIRKPDLDYRPLAYCGKCGKDVNAIQSWKNPLKKWGRYGKRNQYVYRCPHCAEEINPYYYPASTAINWSLIGERIGDRKTPLKPRTMERIRYGLEKFGKQALVFPVDHSNSDGNRARPVGEPMMTQTARQALGFVNPFVVEYYGRDNASSSTTEALSTVTGDPRHALISVPPFFIKYYDAEWNHTASVNQPLSTILAAGDHNGLIVPPPFLFSYYGERHATKSIDDPLPAMTSFDNHTLITPPGFLVEFFGESNARSADQALSTLMAEVNHHGLVQFLMSYYGQGGERPISDPMATVTTLDRHALIDAPTLDPEDCYFRMLTPEEVKKGMAFPDDYTILGNSRERVKQAGNAVTPPAMKWLMAQAMEVFQ